MYNVQFVFHDYKSNTVEVDDGDLPNFLLALQQKQVFFNESKGVGFWLPPENIRFVYVARKLTQIQEEPCQKNQNSEVENASPS